MEFCAGKGAVGLGTLRLHIFTMQKNCGMKYLLLYATLFLATTPINSQITYFDTIYSRDNIQGELKSGFYYAVADTSKSSGFKVYNKDEYYFIGKAPVVTMEEVDTIYKQYHSIMETYVLIFKFNKTATTHWSDFTKRYQNQKVALFLKDTLVFVATIAGQITDGISWIAGDYSEKEIDNFKIMFEKEIRKVKSLH